MNLKYKLAALATILFLLAGIGFTNGLRYKYSSIEEEEIEIVKVNKIKDRTPASNSRKVVETVNSSPQRDFYEKESSVTHFDEQKEDFYKDDFSSQSSSTSMNFASSTRTSNHYAGNDSFPKSRRNSNHNNGETSSSSTGSVISSVSSIAFGNTPSESIGPRQETEKKDPYKISSIAIKNGELILRGSNLSGIKSISVKRESVSEKLVQVSSSASEIIALGLSSVKLTMGKIYDIIITDAYGSSAYPIEIEFADGSITARKLAPLSSSQDGYVLKWSADEGRWVAAPDKVGDSFNSEDLILDIGNNANQILALDENKKLIFNNENILEFDQSSTLSFKENDEEFVFGMFSETFKLRNKTNDTTIFEVVGNDFLINGKAVCLSDKTNCPASDDHYVSSIGVNPPLMASGTDDITLSLNFDPLLFNLSSGQLTITSGAINADYLSSMGANSIGQVLKWNGSSWIAGTDEVGSLTESDPTVQTFAKAALPSCGPHQFLTTLGPLWDGLTCVDLPFGQDEIMIDVQDLLDSKQDLIDGRMEITMKSLKLMTGDENNFVGLTAPVSASSDLFFTLPASNGSIGQILATDGLGKLSWVDAAKGTVTGITASPPLSSSGSGVISLSLSNGGITNSHINDTASIAWSKIDSSGVTVAEFGGVPVSRSIASGSALSGGGDLSANRTLHVNVDNSTVIVNASNKLEVGTVGWSKINKSGASPSDIGAASSSISILSGTGLLGGGNLSANRTLSVDVGTTANKIVQLDGSGKLPAVDGSQLTNLGTNLGKWSDATGGIHYSSGKVGIGTSNPDSKLNIVDSLGGMIAEFEGNPVGENQGVFFRVLNSSTTAPPNSTLNMSMISAATSVANEKDSTASIGALGENYLGNYGLAGEAFLDASNGSTGLNISNRNLAGGPTRFSFGPLEVMRLTQDGKIGMGTVNPKYNLDVQSNTGSAVFGLTSYHDFQGSHFIGFRGRGTESAPSEPLMNDHLALFQGRSALSPNSYPGMRILAAENFTPTTQGAQITFHTTRNGTATDAERVRISNEGFVGIGTKNPTEELHVNGNMRLGITNPVNSGSFPAYGALLNFSGGPAGATFNSDNSDPIFIARYNAASDESELRIGIGDNATAVDALNVGYQHTGVWYSRFKARMDGVGIFTNGTQTCTINPASGVVCSSDFRLKENINPIEHALDKILAIDGVIFTWKDSKSKKKEVGFLAQNVEAFIPELVTEDDQGFKQVNYANFVAVLTEALKEFYQKWVKDSENKDRVIASVNASTEELKDRVELLEKENRELKLAICEINPASNVCKK